MKILITGASSGLGLCLAKEFLNSGDEVWGIGRREFKLKEANESLQKKFRYDQCDTSKCDQVRNIFEKMIKENYIPDKIIFCAGSATNDITEKYFQLDKLKENFDVNLFGVLYWVELFLPYFIKRNSGSISAVSSMSVFLENHKERVGYSASRTALNKVFENLYLNFFSSGVEFTIFNMGRMRGKSGLIGISYSKAAYRIFKTIKSSKCSKQINIPRLQYLLTMVAQLIPKRFFGNYLMKY